ncbi:MAG TPA: hypothetical protein VF437_07070 [Verrucomicrobiae bacterium]
MTAIHTINATSISQPLLRPCTMPRVRLTATHENQTESTRNKTGCGHHFANAHPTNSIISRAKIVTSKRGGIPLRGGGMSEINDPKTSKNAHGKTSL